MVDLGSYCTFQMGGHSFALAAETVREVVPFSEMTRVPLAPEVVGGLLNLRGEIVVAIDLRKRLGLHELQEQPSRPMVIVVDSAEAPVGVLVDELGEVVEVDRDGSVDLPLTVRETFAEFVSEVYKLSNCLLIVLDTERICDIPSVSGGQTTGLQAIG